MPQYSEFKANGNLEAYSEGLQKFWKKAIEFELVMYGLERS